MNKLGNRHTVKMWTLGLVSAIHF